MGLLIRKNYHYHYYDYNDNNNKKNNNNNPSPTRLLPAALTAGLVGFEGYLNSQNKRNIRQILCYAQRYHTVLETGDASALVSLSSGAMRRHAMEALTAYAKYSGLYEEWCQIRKRYSLHWTNGDESLQAMHRFFNEEQLSFDTMLQQIKEMIAKTPSWVGKILRFAVLVGLRPAEVVESVRLLNNSSDWYQSVGTDRLLHIGINSPQYYYNPERQALEHFRFPEIFLRQTKKAFISFVTPDMLPLGIPSSITYNQIRLACRAAGIKCNMRYCRKVFASHLRNEGIQPEVVDMLQGRVSQSVLTRHYLVPQSSLKDQVLKALEQLQRQL